jgi:Fe2+ or Zn2+ uptake regulation protein
VEAEIGRRHGFTQISHRLEFFGVCARCHVPPKPAH